MKRTVYHVIPNGDNGWKAELEKGPVVYEEKIKEDVVKKIKEKARSEEPSQVIVHSSDGNIQYESTYGNDPREYEG